MISRLLHYLTCDKFPKYDDHMIYRHLCHLRKTWQKILDIASNVFLFMITTRLILRSFPTFFGLQSITLHEIVQDHCTSS